MRTAIFLAFVSLAALGCSSRPFVPATPTSFVELKNQYTYDYRATTPEGVVLGARAIDNDPKGDLAFWSQAVELRLRNLGGYALLEKKDVSCLGGLKGTQLRFGHDEESRPHLYYVTLFVTDKRIYVLEAGGEKSQMERYADAIDWSVRNFRPKLLAAERAADLAKGREGAGDDVARFRRDDEIRDDRSLTSRHVGEPCALGVCARDLAGETVRRDACRRARDPLLTRLADLGEHDLPRKTAPLSHRRWQARRSAGRRASPRCRGRRGSGCPPRRGRC